MNVEQWYWKFLLARHGVDSKLNAQIPTISFSHGACDSPTVPFSLQVVDNSTTFSGLQHVRKLKNQL